MGSARPARRFDALRALGDGPAHKAFAERAPSVRFRVPSEVWSSLPRRPADLRNPKTGRRTTLTSLGFVAVRHVPGRRLRVMGGVPPLPRATSGVFTPIAATTTVPPDALRRRSVHRLLSSRRSPRVDRTSFRTSRPSCRSSRRFDRFSGKPSDARRLQGVDLDAKAFGPPGRARTNPRTNRCVAASTRFTPLERSPPASWRRALVARAPRSRSDRSTSRPICVYGSCGSPGSVRPSRGHRLVRGSSPCDRRGFVPTGVEGELMVSPHESCALHAARSTMSPLASGPAEGVPRPKPAVLG